MNFGKFAVMGGDTRFRLLVETLNDDRQDACGFFLAEEESLPLSALQQANCVVLPLPISKDGLHLHAPFTKEAISLDSIFSACHPSQVICGGIVSEEVKNLAQKHKLNIVDYYSQESFILPGALATAEGAIALSISHSSTILQGQSALLLGFGRISKILAQKLSLLGVHVSIAARKEMDLDWAKTLGYHSFPMSHLDEHIHKFDLLFNTVPAPILDFCNLVFLKPSAVYIELASKPYGIDFKSAENLGVHVILAEGLPGKVAPHSMALALQYTIYSLLKNLEVTT